MATLLSPARAALAAAALILAGCAPPKEADIPISDAAAARPAPKLAETARFTRAIDAAVPAIAALEVRRARAATANAAGFGNTGLRSASQRARARPLAQQKAQ